MNALTANMSRMMLTEREMVEMLVWKYFAMRALAGLTKLCVPAIKPVPALR